MAKTSKIIRNNRRQKFSIRHRNRCALCGRPRGYYRMFNICRVCFRELALKGFIPGVTKSSW
jgi:small subunit ribosomal protein S14